MAVESVEAVDVVSLDGDKNVGDVVVILADGAALRVVVIRMGLFGARVGTDMQNMLVKQDGWAQVRSQDLVSGGGGSTNSRIIRAQVSPPPPWLRPWLGSYP